MYNFARTLVFKKSYSALEQFAVFLKGIFVGIFELIPGIGISTLSITLNIYEDYIDLLHNLSFLLIEISKIFVGKFNFKMFKKYFLGSFSDFSIPLIFGLTLGLYIFTFIFHFTVDNAPSYTRALFFGLVLACASTPLKQINDSKPVDRLFLITFFVVFFYIFSWHSTNIFYQPNLFLVALMGILSPLGLFIPGIGSTFFLVIFNAFSYFINIFNNLFFYKLSEDQVIPLLVFVFFYIISFVMSIKLVKLILKRYRSIFMYSLSGIMLASLRMLYPFITVKGDIILYSKIFDLPLGQSIALILVILVAFIFGKSLNGFQFKKDLVEEL